MACRRSNTGLLFLLFFTLFISCNNDHYHGGQGIADKKKFRQYMAAGKKLYIQHCGNCHKDDGSGLVRLYPPLAGSDYIEEDVSRALCIIKYGHTGDMRINNIIFDTEMPGNKQLTSLDYAEISTFVLSEFTKRPSLILPEEIEKITPGCNK
jgi:cytochrome c551